MDYIKLSQEVSYALRHAPWEYELEMDNEGWVPVEQLITALGMKEQWKYISQNDLDTMIELSAKKRHEIVRDNIRAIYGHSVPKKISRTAEIPPTILYHGTATWLVKQILDQGLLPKGRQYVHLSIEKHTAELVGQRKDLKPIILMVNAELAYTEGIIFYRGNDLVWLSDHIPPKYITVVSNLL
ncbi:RNA 2'-phosphotransferase [Paenibacillus ferrarius]|uniref:Probable RNA 2'-phosphotransferase n=1 Tax=Paenibacillus ferrarius TaxID=1469647 RepID=A0A1V4HQK5_9BACL|nr:RNA 2'-phosphotransferase [Paenibacillus ferrarius]OPH60459.1 RNA 2'-phosphotransferase [Paenibacillus ferrarius]